MKTRRGQGNIVKHKYPHKGAQSFSFIGSKDLIFKFILLSSVVALATLFWPFAKSAALAAIFAFAIFGAQDRIAKLSNRRKWIFYSSLGAVVVGFLSAFYSMIDMLLSTMTSFADPSVIPNLKLKITELLLPTLNLVNEFSSKVLVKIDETRVLEAKFTQFGSQFLDSSLTTILEWLYEVPTNTLQFVFFVSALIVIVSKSSLIKRFSMAYLPKKQSDAIEFLTKTAKNSGYNAILTTILTAFAQASLLTLGAVIAGIAAWPIIFLSAFFSAMIPVVGVMPVAVACVIYAESEHNSQMALIVGLFGLAATLIDNLLRPFLISGEDSSLNSLLLFFALIGSLMLFGFSGLFIGPFVLVFSSAVLRRHKIS